MTESEAIEKWKQVYDETDSIYKSNQLDNMFKSAIQALEEIQQYRAIGTVEELEEAKIQFDNINSATNSVALMGLCDFETAKESVISTIKAMKDEAKCDGCAGCTMWKCDCANERAYAIDEFAEKILEYCSMSEMNRKMIKQIAEQMKAGGENE